MRILGIDPGPTVSACVEYLPETQSIGQRGIWNNRELLAYLRSADGAELVFEKIGMMGMAPGESTFETSVWTGRFIEAWGQEFFRIRRDIIKVEICGTTRAKDPNVRRALMDFFGEHGTNPKGPLKGMASHMWAALAVAVAFRKQWEQGRAPQAEV